MTVVRVLAGTIPDWLAPHLDGHTVTVGPEAWQACAADAPTHGRWWTYTHGCRCDDCRTACRDYKRAQRTRRAS